MNGASRRVSGSDPILLIEAALVVLLIALFIFLYVVPTETRLSQVPWWSPLILGSLSLGILLLDSWRRKRRHRREMQRMVEEHRGDER